VLVSGEAGIGKSRLAEEMASWFDQQGGATASARSYATAGGLAYAPVAECLRTPVLRRALAQLDEVWLTELARLHPQLLSERPGLPRPEPLAERWQRQRLFEALASAFLAVNPPLLLVMDDLQWCDPETLEWLHYLLHYDQQAKLLVVGTVRPEEVDDDHPLTILLHNLRRTSLLTEIVLGPLDAEETALLAAQVADRTPDREAASRLHQAGDWRPSSSNLQAPISTHQSAGGHPISSGAALLRRPGAGRPGRRGGALFYL
jgi:predicted ATPase